jgi:hypothetical protein
VRIQIARFAVLLASALPLLAGCDKDQCEPVVQAAAAPDQLADVRKAAENSIRVTTGNPDAVRFRGVQVFPQAIRNQFAACGQANVFGPSSNTFVLFVAVVTRDDVGQDPARKFKADARVGSTVTEATKVYVDTLARCFEGGGPQNARRETIAPVPPMPDDVKAVLAGPAQALTPIVTPSALRPAVPVATLPLAAPAPGGPPGAQAGAQSGVLSGVQPASGTVVMRQAGNIRVSPQGQTVRVEPAGRELHVFGEAPGGWLQVGDTAADGWVHSSLVQRR